MRLLTSQIKDTAGMERQMFADQKTLPDFRHIYGTLFKFRQCNHFCTLSYWDSAVKAAR